MLRSPLRRRRAVHDGALHEIGVAIMRGTFPQGSLLPRKEALLEWLDVSHVTLREALQTLSAKGMIVARARVGTRVLDERHWNMFDADLLAWRLEIGITASFLASLLEIRQSIEPLAAALAATRRTADDVERLRALVAVMRREPDRTGTFVEADVAFHRLILEMSGNPFMSSLAALVGAALSVSFGVSAPAEDPKLARLVHRQHMAILDAIEAGDAQRASDAMAVVIRQGWLNYCGLRPERIASLELQVFPVAETGRSPKGPQPGRATKGSQSGRPPAGSRASRSPAGSRSDRRRMPQPVDDGGTTDPVRPDGKATRR